MILCAALAAAELSQEVTVLSLFCAVSWGRLKLNEELMGNMQGEFKCVGSVERKRNTEV